MRKTRLGLSFSFIHGLIGDCHIITNTNLYYGYYGHHNINYSLNNYSKDKT